MCPGGRRVTCLPRPRRCRDYGEDGSESGGGTEKHTVRLLSHRHSSLCREHISLPRWWFRGGGAGWRTHAAEGLHLGNDQVFWQGTGGYCAHALLPAGRCRCGGRGNGGQEVEQTAGRVARVTGVGPGALLGCFEFREGAMPQYV